MFSDDILKFYKSLEITEPLPAELDVMNPYQDDTAWYLSSAFYKKFYADTNRRRLIVGINPGRFGGGITGVPFTDPVKLAVECGIPNDLKKKVELSADYIYAMINAYGGPAKFYADFYISAISPLGFTREDKNLNYYDMPELQRAIEPFVIRCFEQQLTFNIDTRVCFCLGEGKNFHYLSALNTKHKFFKSVVPLAHPRFIMQYKRKMVATYIQSYLKVLQADY
ncbi:uracil-DNA glycosylase family protein [Pseudochryseolinea flava]|uniref:DUF4918 domain-containing protein n=1 Tax=Pseudochryseolinea flava TaxID=2059302 RepID=A0A364Y1K4_9BACT|nr:uracil-DNA glycosylase family protein [Pseudochryseolinea flava]RAW00721.1 DUF4918 domain-containing protein [Pseudochryseolinea flava]